MEFVKILKNIVEKKLTDFSFNWIFADLHEQSLKADKAIYPVAFFRFNNPTGLESTKIPELKKTGSVYCKYDICISFYNQSNADMNTEQLNEICSKMTEQSRKFVKLCQKENLPQGQNAFTVVDNYNPVPVRHKNGNMTGCDCFLTLSFVYNSNTCSNV
jgi:hypothetical protein